MYNTIPNLKRYLEDPAVNMKMVKALAVHLFGKDKPEMLAEAALILDTPALQPFLAEQRKFLFSSISRSRDPKYARYARLLIERGIP